MRFNKGPAAIAAAGVVTVIVVSVYFHGFDGGAAKADLKPAAVATPSSAQSSGAAASAGSVDLNDEQVKSIKINVAADRVFPLQRTAVGTIDFNQDLSVQVFAPYQGKIIKAYAEVGDEVVKGQTLYTIDSPDLIQAESTLIAAAGLYDLTTTALTRAKQLYEAQGLAQKDYEQAVSDQQTAEGAVKAGRDAVRVFGKTEADIDAIVAKRKIDPKLVVLSPISGRVTARVAQPGLLVQPGNAPAPYSVADTSTMWMLANVAESNVRYISVGQKVKATTIAYPDQVYEGKITVIGATVDPYLHTRQIRSDIENPRGELVPGMITNFVIRIGDPVTAAAVPTEGVVREPDGTMTIWVTTDRHHFTQRKVKLGLQSDGYDQVLDGLTQGELVVTDGAILLDNMLTPGTSD